MTSYIYSISQFNPSYDSTTWCNSDNPSFFASFTQTECTLYPSSLDSGARTDVFLVFKDQNCIVHVYENWVIHSTFTYYYSPVGLHCTAVAVSVVNGKVFSCFKEFTIAQFQFVELPMQETTAENFMMQLDSLN